MYVPSRTPKYVCQKCLSKIPIPDLDSGFYEHLTQYFISAENVSSDDIDTVPLSDRKSRVTIDHVDTGVPNHLFGNGATFSDLISSVAIAKNHGDFVSAVAHLTSDWKRLGLIDGKSKGRIDSQAAVSSIP
jgi:hypothetical protein